MQSTQRFIKKKIVKPAKRSHSSHQWLSRQVNDPYVQMAQKLGYRSRAAFKLEEIDAKFKIIKHNTKAVDLGCAPGGWLQVLVNKQKNPDQALIMGIDLLDVDPHVGVHFIKGDFHDPVIIDSIFTHLNQQKVDLVLSDMAASTTGHQKIDNLRTMALAESALSFALKVLSADGVFVTKLFRGASDKEFEKLCRLNFKACRFFKPQSSRKDSSEIYMVATGFKGS